MAQTLSKINLCWALLAVPLNSSDGWISARFAKIANNRASFSVADGLRLEINRSSSPVVRRLSNTAHVTSIRARVRIASGELKTPPERFPDDMYLRIGLVAHGDKQLTRMQRWLAPDWVKALYDALPTGLGLDRLWLYELSDQSQRVGESRIIPGSRDLMYEKISAARQDNDEMVLHWPVEPPVATVAVWLSADGDNVGAKFDIQLRELILETRDEPSPTPQRREKSASGSP